MDTLSQRQKEAVKRLFDTASLVQREIPLDLEFWTFYGERIGRCFP